MWVAVDGNDIIGCVALDTSVLQLRSVSVQKWRCMRVKQGHFFARLREQERDLVAIRRRKTGSEAVRKLLDTRLNNTYGCTQTASDIIGSADMHNTCFGLCRRWILKGSGVSFGACLSLAPIECVEWRAHYIEG